MKGALTSGAAAAISKLGVPGGFLDNPKVRIPLPPALDEIAKGMRFIGRGKDADELVTAMNRAAEQAVPQAKGLIVNAVKSMSNQFAAQGAKLGLVKGDAASIEEYVTHKALDGLFLMIGEEERAIRQDPVAAGSAIVTKVFGALK